MLSNKERTIGATGLSVGTHLAMETLFKWIEPFDPEREKPLYIDLSLYSCYYFNLFTIARNLANSFSTEKDKVKIYGDKEYPSLLGNEISILRGLFDQIGLGIKLVIYKCDYSKALKIYNNGKGDPETMSYVEFVMIENRLNEIIRKEKSVSNQVTVSSFRLPKPPTGTVGSNYLITTSISFDLLNKGNLSLLESHTGKIKTRDKFYTKFHTIGNKDLSSIPYTEETLYIMGDKFLIRPLNLAYRRSLLAMAYESNWSYKTSPAIVRTKLLSDVDFNHYIKDMKKLYI